MPKRVAKPVKQATPKKCKTSTSTDTNCNNIPTSAGTNWNNMPMEMKAMIMKNMDFVTRASLKTCSKLDKCLVEAFPMVIEKLTASLPSHGGREFILIDTEESSSVLEVSQFGKRLTVTKNGKKRIHRLDSEKEAEAKIVNCFYGLLLAKNIKIKHLETQWNISDHHMKKKHISNLHALKLTNSDENECIKWLRHVAPESKGIAIDFDCKTRLRKLVSWVLQSQRVSLESSVINNDILIKLKATHLTLLDSYVDINGVRSLSKKWIDEDYPIGSEFALGFEPWTLSTDEILIGMEQENMENDRNKVKIRMGNTKLMCFEIARERPRWMLKGRVVAKE